MQGGREVGGEGESVRRLSLCRRARLQPVHTLECFCTGISRDKTRPLLIWGHLSRRQGDTRGRCFHPPTGGVSSTHETPKATLFLSGLRGAELKFERFFHRATEPTLRFITALRGCCLARRRGRSDGISPVGFSRRMVLDKEESEYDAFSVCTGTSVCVTYNTGFKDWGWVCATVQQKSSISCQTCVSVTRHSSCRTEKWCLFAKVERHYSPNNLMLPIFSMSVLLGWSTSIFIAFISGDPTSSFILHVVL